MADERPVKLLTAAEIAAMRLDIGLVDPPETPPEAMVMRWQDERIVATLEAYLDLLQMLDEGPKIAEPWSSTDASP